MEHSANLETEEDYRNVVFVSFSPHLGENNTYAGRIIESDRDPSLATFQISDHAGKLNVKEIKSLHFRLAKKVRVSKNGMCSHVCVFTSAYILLYADSSFLLLLSH